MRSETTSDISLKTVDLDFNELPIERALGIIWDTKSNLLNFIFAPVAIENPSVLEAKLIIQKLWKRTTEWDTGIPNNLKQRWDDWKNSLDDLEKIEIPR